MVADSRFARQFRRQGVPQLLNYFGERELEEDDEERLLFRATPSSTTERRIRGLVNRSTISIIQETAEVPGQAIMISVPNDSECGISSDEIDTGGNQVWVALRLGEDPEWRSITRVLSDDGGLVKFLVQ